MEDLYIALFKESNAGEAGAIVIGLVIVAIIAARSVANLTAAIRDARKAEQTNDQYQYQMQVNQFEYIKAKGQYIEHNTHALQNLVNRVNGQTDILQSLIFKLQGREQYLDRMIDLVKGIPLQLETSTDKRLAVTDGLIIGAKEAIMQQNSANTEGLKHQLEGIAETLAVAIIQIKNLDVEDTGNVITIETSKPEETPSEEAA